MHHVKRILTSTAKTVSKILKKFKIMLFILENINHYIETGQLEVRTTSKARNAILESKRSSTRLKRSNKPLRRFATNIKFW